jgi:hypothetical protein
MAGRSPGWPAIDGGGRAGTSRRWARPPSRRARPPPRRKATPATASTADKPALGAAAGLMRLEDLE